MTSTATTKPAKLPATADPRCGSTSGYKAHWKRGEQACAPCTAASRLAARRRRSTEAGREAANEANRLRRSTPAGRQADLAARQAVYARLRARTEVQADADFLAKHGPSGKPCQSCGELLPASAFNRNWTTTDGRAPRCTPCYNKHQRLKRWTKLVDYWIARGLDPSHCSYCLRSIGPADRDVDHFHPISRGGPDHPDNLVPSCPKCNRGQGGKFDRDPFEWLAQHHPNRLEFFRALYPEETE